MLGGAGSCREVLGGLVGGGVRRGREGVPSREAGWAVLGKVHRVCVVRRGAHLSLLHQEKIDLSDDRDLAAEDAALLQVARHGLLELEPHLAVGRGAAAHDLGGEGLAELLGRRSLGELGEPLEGLTLDAYHFVRAVDLRAIPRGQSVLWQPVLERLHVFQRDGLLLGHAPPVAICIEDRTKADGHLLLLEGHTNKYLPVRVVRRVRQLSVLHCQLLLVRAWPASQRVTQPLVALQGHGLCDGFAWATIAIGHSLHQIGIVHWMAREWSGSRCRQPCVPTELREGY